MDRKPDINTWLEIAFTEPCGRINESYFFDRKANEFYSVFITDYFLTDPDLSDEEHRSPYSAEELELLTERMNRAENNDPSIIPVPRLTIEERKELIQTFLDVNNLHSKAYEEIAEAENGRTDLMFTQFFSGEIQNKWQAYKQDFVWQKVATFCNLNSIDIETATLWTDAKATTMSLNIHDTTPKDNVSKKPWWKFW